MTIIGNYFQRPDETPRCASNNNGASHPEDIERRGRRRATSCESRHDVRHFPTIGRPYSFDSSLFVLAAHACARTMMVIGNKIVGFSSKKEIKCAGMAAG
jgi:hypothetical protein